jgi:murein DD-endopeptidase MepM/ murein hydrolase activator NlpD
MTNKKLHIIVTGESGKARSLALKKTTLRSVVITATLITCILGIGTFFGVRNIEKNRELNAIIESSEAVQQHKLAVLQKQLDAVSSEKDNLANNYQQKLETFKKNQEALLEERVSEFEQRSKVIETVINELGVRVKRNEKSAADHSGGPFISIDDYSERLITDADSYLSLIKKMPLGFPIYTEISSPYGRRSDPLNKHRAFHEGIDFKGNTGDQVRATGDAVVKKAAYVSGYGNCLVLLHGNGYETMYAHLSKQLVTRGDQVKRGQVIGLVGNTGRSTGSHLHYEVRRWGKAINPLKYMRVNGMTVTASN